MAAGTDVISKEKASHVFPELSRFRSKRYDLRKNGFAQAREGRVGRLVSDTYRNLMKLCLSGLSATTLGSLSASRTQFHKRGQNTT